MADATVTYVSDSKACCGELPADVILCVDSSKLAPTDCEAPAAETYQLGYIEAQLTSQSDYNPSWGCGGNQFQMEFLYDDTLLLDTEDPLVTNDITGVLCKNCFTNWVEEIVGMPVTLTDNAGTITLTNQYGCTYTFTPSFLLSLQDSNSIDLSFPVADTLQADLIVDPAANNTIQVSASGVLVEEFTVQDTNSIDLTVASGPPQDLQADLIVSPDTGNQLTVDANGTYSGWYPEEAVFGDGSDGDRLVVGAEDMEYPVRDYYFDNLTINGGASLKPYGYWQSDGSGDPTDRGYVRIFVRDTLIVNGSINADGANASGQTGGARGALDGSGGGDDNGGDGGDGDTGGGHTSGTSPGRKRDLNFGLMGGGLGGSGGASDATGGDTTGDGYEWKAGHLISSLLTPSPSGQLLVIGGGCGGGGGGGGDRTGTAQGGDGGGGGAGGGTVFICAKNIVINVGGVISANGGDGADGADGVAGGGGDDAGSGGGGGAGGGGLVFLVYETLTNSGTIEAVAGTAGAGGAAVNAGTVGAAGAAGADGNVYRFKFPEKEFQ